MCCILDYTRNGGKYNINMQLLHELDVNQDLGQRKEPTQSTKEGKPTGSRPNSSSKCTRSDRLSFQKTYMQCMW
jgi:hypothetical protein